MWLFHCIYPRVCTPTWVVVEFAGLNIEAPRSRQESRALLTSTNTEIRSIAKRSPRVLGHFQNTRALNKQKDEESASHLRKYGHLLYYNSPAKLLMLVIIVIKDRSDNPSDEGLPKGLTHN